MGPDCMDGVYPEWGATGAAKTVPLPRPDPGHVSTHVVSPMRGSGLNETGPGGASQPKTHQGERKALGRRKQQDAAKGQEKQKA